MIIYSDKLTYVWIVINCQYSVAQMCTCEDRLAHYLGAVYLDDLFGQISTHTGCYVYVGR